jgi:geranylgeranyl pyrophosphate synthase
MGLINKHEGIGYTLTKARACTDRAKGQLEAFEPTIERAAMIAVADYVIERNH